MITPVVSITHRNVFQVRIGDRVTSMEAGTIGSNYAFITDEINEWRGDNGEIVKMSDQDRTLVVQSIEKYFHTNWARRIFREKCIFIDKNQKISISEPFGVRVLKYLKGIK